MVMGVDARRSPGTATGSGPVTLLLDTHFLIWLALGSVAHSLARRVPLCTVDRRIRAHHRLIAAE